MADIQREVVEQATTTTITFAEYLKVYNSFEGGRTEWLGGEVAIYPMSNNIQHLDILQFLSWLLSAFVSKHKLGRTIPAGFPMFVGDDKPAREPDYMVVRSDHVERIKHTYLDGIADVVVEVVSPESVARDRGKKLAEYEALGVPEYWLIDPQRTDARFYALGVEGNYHPLPLDARGWLTSAILPGFALDPNILWRDVLPSAIEVFALVEAMESGNDQPSDR
jgi:Uma2 family endonuclease